MDMVDRNTPHRHPTGAHRCRWALGPLCLIVTLAWVSAASHAQTAGPSSGTTPEIVRFADLDGALFYQLLVAEMQLLNNDAGAAYSLMLDAANRTRRPELYRRAVEIALQNRAGNAALSAAQDWARAYPESDEPLRYELQILLALNRPADVTRTLTRLIELAPPERRHEVINSIPQALVRTSDRAIALQVARDALRNALRDRQTAGTAWAAIGRMEMHQQNLPAALQAARSGLQAQPQSVFAAALAAELFELGVAEAQALIDRFLEQPAAADLEQRHTIHVAYIRTLLDNRQWQTAQANLERLLAQNPNHPEAWLLQGILQFQLRLPTDATRSLERFLGLAPTLPPDQARIGRTQAYLQLAQIAEQQRNFQAASAWLDRVENGDDLLFAQLRRASLLARQGQIAEARALIQRQPSRHESDARRKLLAEAQMLREVRAYAEALEVYTALAERFPLDPDIIYEQALAAFKAGDFALMETLLRGIMSRHPEYYHAFNALGYLLADRNERLEEARQLILIALAASPNDAHILDSLGWVEFRMGNKEEALRILRDAYRRMPDAEIAAHLGEVLWALNQRDDALVIWREGLLLDPENTTLLETLQRLQARP
jgi:tetratricopeptide (TPR) repeat protein